MSGVDGTGLATNLAVSAGAVLVVLTATWLVALRRGEHRIVDIMWGPGFGVVALVSLLLSIGAGDLGRRLLVAALTIGWGARLGAHIYRRGRGKGEDPRYASLLGNAGGSTARHAYLHIYAPQAAIMWFVSLPVQVAMYERGAIGAFAVVPIAVWLLGFGFESVGDHQLAAFTADPANKGKVLERGLWRYTRHPNYFGDACVWWGIYLAGVTHWLGAAMILSPAVMTFLLAKGTGKPLLEKGMARTRPGYADYVARTSGFVPMPPKRPANS